jgi:hypothetical protein
VLTTAELCDVTGIPAGTVARLRGDGRIVPAKVGTPGCRSGHRWSAQQTLAFACWRLLRGRGVSPDDAECCRRWLEVLSEQELHERFARGEELLLIVGDSCKPALVGMRAVLAVVSDTSGSGAGVLASGINVKQLHRHLIAEAAVCFRSGHGPQCDRGPAESQSNI